MNYFYDTEFLEGTQKKWFGRKTKPTIDLISIGIVAEDGREYYAISKEFNLKEAWNRFDKVEVPLEEWLPGQPEFKKVYWIRENVLKPIFEDWKLGLNGKIIRLGLPLALNKMEFTYRNFKYCIKCIGKSNEQIANEILVFTRDPNQESINSVLGGYDSYIHHLKKGKISGKPVNFYGYYSAYDHVVLCWLFGKMIDLPEGFPKYTRDLKHMLDEKPKAMLINMSDQNEKASIPWSQLPEYPKQDTSKAHNALEDARWNKSLYEFMQKF